MVERSLHSEMFLQLVFSVDEGTSEQSILKKSIPLYLRKLNCFLAAVLKNTDKGFEEKIVMPFVFSKSKDWTKLKAHFSSQSENKKDPCNKKEQDGFYYYPFCLSTYGTLILGRKTPFDEMFINELKPVVNHLGKALIQANEREERNKAEKALRVSEERYRTLFENMGDAVTTLDMKGNFIDVNQKGLDLIEYSREEVLSMSVDQMVYKEDKTSSDIYFSNLRKEGFYELYEGRIKTKSGKIIWIQVSSTAMFQDGIQIGSQDIIRDITNRKEFEYSLHKTTEQLSQLNAEKDKFFSIIAHDLRSPFNSFLGLTQILEEEMHSLTIEQLQTFAVSLRSSAANLFGLLENLLHWARSRQGLIPYNPEPIRIIQAIKECVTLSNEMAKNKDIKIIYNIEDELTGYADSNMLQTIFRNLVSNAIKFTPKGGEINISAEFTKEEEIVISIKDTGIGMNKSLLENLFRLDVETNRAGTEEEPSSGLGLILCKEFAEKQGGKIWAESEVGRGSTFYVTIPSKA